MTKPPPVPLINDPAREAVDSLRGYSYQLLRSIEAWLDLEEGEILVLEGAEDLDQISHSGAIVEQVKDTAKSGSITLRSVNAINAVNNFWAHLKRNSGIPVRFRYLTTSIIGREKGKSLGLAGPGIEAWQSIQANPSDANSQSDANAIRIFLAGHRDISSAFRNWLANASVDEFIAQVIEPFEWVTGRSDIAGLRRMIEARLVELGETRKIAPADAATALGQLHLEAWTIVTNRDRPPLRRGDLLRILDAAGTVAFPKSQLLNLMNAIVGAPADTTITLGNRVVENAPRAPARRHPRPELEAEIGGKLDGKVVHIYGSTGMGKTALAAVVTASRQRVGWINLRDLENATIRARLDAASVVVAKQGAECTIVLDDLDAGADSRMILPSIDRLRRALEVVGGSLLITSSQLLPPRLATTIGVVSENEIEAPSFEDWDIEAYLIAEGCPSEIAKTWSRIVFASTSGHPQLVDARVGALSALGFPAPSIDEILTPPAELLDVRAEARRMVSALPDGDRELLCRMSLLTGRISRSRLIAIAKIKPPIDEPGHVIDRLTGPWLERTDTADLRASPLLRNLGADARGQAWAQAMHGQIAWAYLSERTLTATDVSSILMHAIIGGTAGPIVHVMPSLLQAPDEIWGQIGETSGIYAYVGLSADQPPPFKKPIDTAAFRVFQLRIASELGDEQLEAVVARHMQESDRPAQERDLGVRFFDFLFVWQLLQHGAAGRSLREVVDLGIRFVRTGEEVRDELDRLREPDGASEGEQLWPNLAPFLKLTLIPAIVDADKLEQLLAIADELNPEDRALVLTGYAGDEDGAALALDRIWLGEAQREEPNWTRLVALLERTIVLGSSDGIPSLAAAAAPLLVRVIDENLNDSAAALETAEHLLGELGRQPRLLAAMAKVHWRADDAAKSLPMYEEALKQFPLPAPWLTDVIREAAIAAARANQWLLSASRFGEAVASLAPEEPLARRAGLQFDRGLALYLAGSTREAVDSFAVAMDEMIADGQEVPPEPLLSARQLGSHAIKLISMDLRGEKEVSRSDMARYLGRCSSLDTLAWDEQRPAPLDVIVETLVELDLLVGDPPVVAQRLAPRLRQSRDLLASAVSGGPLVQLAIRTLQVEHVVSDTIRQLKFLAHAKAEHDAGREDFGQVDVDPSDSVLGASSVGFVTLRIVAAIVAMQAAGRINELPFDRWRSDLPSSSEFDHVRALIDDAERLYSGGAECWPRVLGGNPNWEAHVLAALSCLARGQLSPDQVIVCHAIAAQYLNQPMLGELTAETFSRMVTDEWLDLCDKPASLVAPRVTVPEIRGAATRTEVGWPRIRAIMIAALSAVSARAAGSIRDVVTNLPQ